VQLIYSGKVRDLYADGDDLILVASDPVSIYDVVLPTPIPDEGKILTQLSLWWFGQLADIVPDHVISASRRAAGIGPGGPLGAVGWK
jgi:phosphoribosylaminoimidazole-succinocarboxamide synthase